MEQVDLAVEPRTILGKKVRFVRRTGYVPANIYGKGRESRAVQVEAKALVQALQKTGRSGFLSLRMNGDTQLAMARAVQLDPRTNKVSHVDFYAVSLTDKLTTDLPLELSGEQADLRVIKGQLIRYLSKLSIRALPMDVPRNIQVDISGLKEIDQVIMVKDLKVPAGVEVLALPEEIVAKVEMIREEKLPEAAELPAEVEVVGKGGKEEGEEGEAEAAAPAKASKETAAPKGKEAAPKGKEKE